MPPGQPIHRCHVCGLYRPCKKHWGVWLCVDHAPKPTTDNQRLATDGGNTDD